jgi:hypothetical protein
MPKNSVKMLTELAYIMKFSDTQHEKIGINSAAMGWRTNEAM